MNARKFYMLDQCPLFKMQSRKKLAREVFNVELSLLERLAKESLNKPRLQTRTPATG